MDYRTLFFTYLASLTIYAAFASLLAFYNRKVRGLCWISAGLLVAVLKVILQGLEGKIPTVFSSLVANELYLLSFVLQMLGLRWFVTRVPLRRRWPLVLLAGFATTYALLYLFHVPYIANLINLPTLVLIGFTGWMVLDRGKGIFTRVARWAAVFLFAEMLVSLYRAVLTNLVYARPWEVVRGQHDPHWLYSLMAMMFASSCVVLCEFWFFVVELQGELREQARTDPLTGALNRRALYVEADREIHRSLRNGHSLGVLVIDVDNFKEMNDAHGHAAGDLCLQSLVRLLRNTLRRQDILARTGGEEFTVLLPDTPKQDARNVAERLRAAAEQLNCSFAGTSVCLSVSIGLAAMAPTCAAFEPLFHQADVAMYQAKRLGKNRVAEYPDGPEDFVPEPIRREQLPAVAGKAFNPRGEWSRRTDLNR